MFKRFLAIFGLMLLYMGVLALIIMPGALFYRGNDLAVIIIALAVTFLGTIAFIPYLNFIARRVFHFPGEGEPVSGDELRARILEINEFDAPVIVQQRKGKLIVTWRYIDARWWELLAKAGMTRIYELHIRFREDRREVMLIDVNKSVSWGAGPTGVRVSGGFFRGISFEYELGRQWGIRENLTPGKVYDYRFTPGEIRTPVMNTIIRSGWGVRLGMW